MSEPSKDEIAAWAAEVYEQSQRYADVLEKRIRPGQGGSAVRQLDSITAMARRLYWDLTGKLPPSMSEKVIQ